MHKKEKSTKQRANEIELYLKQEKKLFKKLSSEPKILILGSSDSGKSTLLKQMKLSHGDGFSSAERDSSKIAILKNIFASVVALLETKFDQDYSCKQVFHFLMKKYDEIYIFAQEYLPKTPIPNATIKLFIEMWEDRSTKLVLESMNTLPCTTE